MPEVSFGFGYVFGLGVGLWLGYVLFFRNNP